MRQGFQELISRHVFLKMNQCEWYLNSARLHLPIVPQRVCRLKELASMTDENRQLDFSNPTVLDGEGEITPVISPSRAPNSASDYDTPNASASDAQISKALVPSSPLPVAIASTNGGRNDGRSVVPYAGEGTQVVTASTNGTRQVQTVARLERSGETSKQIAAVHVQGAQVQVGNAAVGVIKAEAMFMEERKVVHHAIKMTDDGEFTPRNDESSVVPYAGEGTQVVPASTNGTRQVQTVARLERSGETSKQVAAVKVQSAEVQVGNAAVGLIRAEEMVAEERKVVHQAIEMTDDGEITLRHYERTERIFRLRVIEILYIYATNEPEEVEEPKIKEKCIDCCCQSFNCNIASMMRRLFSRTRNPDAQPAVKKADFMTPVLRRGRSKGWVLHSKAVFPLVGSSFRKIWVLFELVAVALALLLSIASFTLGGKNKTFNLLHLALTILGSILAIIDGLTVLSGCSLYKECKSRCSHVPESEEKDSEAGENSDIHEKGDKDVEADQVDSVEQSGCKGRCKECINATRTVFDFIRVIISELIFYPLLMCDIFEMIVGKAFMFENGVDVISFILFIISTVSLLFYVYILRIYILVVANITSQKKRKPEPVEGKDKNNEFDHDINKSAAYFQAYFIFHVIAQMVAQIFMIIAIAAKIRDDNRHLFDSRVVTNSTNSSVLMNTDNMGSMDESIHVSGYLWYMLVMGYILPVFGFLSFFIVTYFWVQEFPIGICIDMVSLLLMPMASVNDASKPKKKEEVKKRIEKITKYLHYAELKKQFKGLRGTKWLDKFEYPFKSPQMVILCLIYAILQLAFILSAGLVNEDEDGIEGRPLGGGYWIYFYGFSIIVGFIANIYVFTIALFWGTIIVGVLALIFLAILAFLFYSCIITCAQQDINRKNRQR